MPPSLLHILEGDVGWHFGCQFADASGNFALVSQISACELKGRKQFNDGDPTRIGVVIAKLKFHFFAGHGKSLNQPHSPIDPGQATSAVLQAPGDYLEGESSIALDVQAEQARID